MLSQLFGVKFFGGVIYALIIIVGLSSFFEHFFPGFISFTFLAAASAAFIFLLVIGGFGSTIQLLKNIVIWTWPFWIFSLAAYLLSISPITAFMPAERLDATINVTSSALVSIGGLLYWRFARFQELARDAGVFLALSVHAFMLLSVQMDGELARDVLAWGMGALSITLATAMIIYQPPQQTYFSRAAIVVVLMAIILSISVSIWPVKPAHIIIAERARSLADSLMTDEHRARVAELSERYGSAPGDAADRWREGRSSDGGSKDGFLPGVRKEQRETARVFATPDLDGRIERPDADSEGPPVRVERGGEWGAVLGASLRAMSAENYRYNRDALEYFSDEMRQDGLSESQIAMVTATAVFQNSESGRIPDQGPGVPVFMEGTPVNVQIEDYTRRVPDLPFGSAAAPRWDEFFYEKAFRSSGANRRIDTVMGVRNESIMLHAEDRR